MRKFTLIPQDEITIVSTNVTDPRPVYDSNTGYADGAEVQYENGIYEVYNILLSERITYPKCQSGRPANIGYTDIGITTWDGVSPTSTKRCSNRLDIFNPYITDYAFTNISNASGVIYANMSIDGGASISITVYGSYELAPIGDYFLEAGELYEKIAVVNSWGHDLKYLEALNQNKIIDDDGGTASVSESAVVNYTFQVDNCIGCIVTGLSAGSFTLTTRNYGSVKDERFILDARVNTPTKLFEFVNRTSIIEIIVNKNTNSANTKIGNIYFINDTLNIGISSYKLTNSTVNYGKVIEKLGGKYEYIEGVTLDKYNIEVRQELEKLQEIKEDIKAFGKKKSGWEITPDEIEGVHIVTIGRLGDFSLATIVEDGTLDTIFSMSFNIEETS